LLTGPVILKRKIHITPATRARFAALMPASNAIINRYERRLEVTGTLYCGLHKTRFSEYVSVGWEGENYARAEVVSASAANSLYHHLDMRFCPDTIAFAGVKV